MTLQETEKRRHTLEQELQAQREANDKLTRQFKDRQSKVRPQSPLALVESLLIPSALWASQGAQLAQMQEQTITELRREMQTLAQENREMEDVVRQSRSQIRSLQEANALLIEDTRGWEGVRPCLGCGGGGERLGCGDARGYPLRSQTTGDGIV